MEPINAFEGAFAGKKKSRRSEETKRPSPVPTLPGHPFPTSRERAGASGRLIYPRLAPRATFRRSFRARLPERVMRPPAAATRNIVLRHFPESYRLLAAPGQTYWTVSCIEVLAEKVPDVPVTVSV